VIVPLWPAPAHAIAAHVMVDVAALGLQPGKAGGSGDMEVGASFAEAEVAMVDEVAIIQAEKRVD
jgi:hypothetical protein